MKRFLAWIRGLFSRRQTKSPAATSAPPHGEVLTKEQLMEEMGLAVDMPAEKKIPLPSAEESLQKLPALRSDDADWEQIWQTLNPDGEPQLQELLVGIRGPHMFAPALGLNVIEHGCHMAMAVDPQATLVDALRAATDSSASFTRDH